LFSQAFANFTYCLESARFQPNVKHCANYANIDAEKLEDCFNGEMGDTANAEMAKATASLSPAHLGKGFVKKIFFAKFVLCYDKLAGQC
jgi:hypothetical protein